MKGSTLRKTVTLYGYPTSPFVQKVACYLYYKQLDFEFVGVSPLDPEKTIGFTKGRTVPVLKIGDEWRRDSSKLGVWLDALYPEMPLRGLDAAELAEITKIDDWASEQFIPGMIFRTAVDGEMNEAFRKRAWRLADIVSASSRLPEPVKKMWPDLLVQAPFIVAMVEQLDRTEALPDMQQRLFGELIGHIGGGPYLGGLESPSLADFAIYAPLIFAHQLGLDTSGAVLAHPIVGPWLCRVASHLPNNPWCVGEDLIVKDKPSS